MNYGNHFDDASRYAWFIPDHLKRTQRFDFLDMNGLHSIYQQLLATDRCRVAAKIINEAFTPHTEPPSWLADALMEHSND